MSTRADLNDDRYDPTGESTSTRPTPGTGVWYPKPAGSFTPNLIISTGAAAQGAAAIDDPESGVYNAWTAKSSVTGGLNSLDPGQQWIFNVVAAGRNKGARYKTSASSVHDKFVNEATRFTAQGKRVTPVELAWREAVSKGWIKDGKPTIAVSGSSSSGGGRYSSGGSSAPDYTGPLRRVDRDFAPAFDVRAIADEVSMEMLGRGVTQEEMERILKRVRKYEQNNPQLTVQRQKGQFGQKTITRTEGGASNAGRQEVIERIIAQNPEFKDYSKASTMMDWFDRVLSERMQASNGI